MTVQTKKNLMLEKSKVHHLYCSEGKRETSQSTLLVGVKLLEAATTIVIAGLRNKVIPYLYSDGRFNRGYGGHGLPKVHLCIIIKHY